MGERDPRRWYDITAAAGDKATVRIYGDIGTSWWDDDAVSAASFAKDLDDIGSVGQIEVHLNSPGGIAFDGVTIMNLLKDHPANVTVYVDGLAASAASIIAMAGDEVVMGRGAQMMIHDAATWSAGNADQLRKDAEVLDGLSQAMAEVYAERTGKTAAEMRDAMRAETWYSDAEAVEAGLADRRSAATQTDDTDVVAMLRASKAVAVAHYRYQGRAAAPAPLTPSQQAGQNTPGGAVEIADEDMTALRDKLGLPEDATIADVLDALDEQEAPEDQQAAAKGSKAPLAQLPDGVVAIDKTVLEELRQNAAAGAEARKTQQAQHRQTLVADALRTGRIRAADKARWLHNLELDPEGYEATLAALEPGLVPVAEKGYDDGSVEDNPATIEAVKASPAYTNWTV